MKVTKLLYEGKRIEFDKNGFEKAAYSFIKNALKKIPFNITLDNIEIKKIEKTKSPVSFDIDINILISGNDLIAKYKRYQKGNQITLDYRFYGLPGNIEITEDTLKNLPTYDHTIGEDLNQHILSLVSTKGNVTSRVDIYKQKFNEVQQAINKIEKSYNVKLELKLYPDVDEFSKDPGDYYAFNVYVRDIEGCLGKFAPPKPGDYYEYIVNGKSYSNFLDYQDHYIIFGYGWWETKVSLKEFNITEFSNMIQRRLGEFIARVKLLDYLIINEKNIENEFNSSLQKLKKKYPNIKIGIMKENTWRMPQPICVYVTSLSYNEKFIFTIEELSTKEGISNAITKIQRKIYKLLKTSNTNMTPYVKSFIEENIDLLTTDLDEFYRLADQKRIDLRMLTYVLTEAGIDIAYTLNDIPDIIKDII